MAASLDRKRLGAMATVVNWKACAEAFFDSDEIRLSATEVALFGLHGDMAKKKFFALTHRRQRGRGERRCDGDRAARVC
jgi:hypothetical protein